MISSVNMKFLIFYNYVNIGKFLIFICGELEKNLFRIAIHPIMDSTKAAGMKKLSKTAVRILKAGYFIVSPDEPRLMKAMRELEALKMVTVETTANGYGFTYYRVKKKETSEVK